jgi:polysaccharide export outer membrane protein
MLRIVGIAVLLLLAGACSSSNDPDRAGNGADFTLAPGDTIKLAVAGEKELSGEFTVDGAGAITAPVVGAIPVKGLTLAETASSYAAKLREGEILRDPKVTAEGVGLRPIFVLGEVKRPGRYAYVGGLTLKSAIELAEGYSYYAKESTAELTRGGRTVEVDVAADIKVLPGDTVRIPKRFF